jgi:hypothetical protein
MRRERGGLCVRGWAAMARTVLTRLPIAWLSNCVALLVAALRRAQRTGRVESEYRWQRS